MTDSSTHPMTADIEAALLRQLRSEYEAINNSYFRNKLAPAVIALSNHTSKLGQWNRITRTIELSRQLIFSHSWAVVIEVLKHEMAHQYVEEHLGVTHETAHGPAFQEICHRLGFDARAVGTPKDATNNNANHDILERVSKLLALAESTNEHEAQSAMNLAQKLIAKYNVTVANNGTSTQHYTFRQLGKPLRRVFEHQRIIGAILAKHFFVQAIWVPTYNLIDKTRASILEVCGTLPNLEMADYVHAFLSHTVEQCWNAHKKHTRSFSNRDRLTFMAGAMTGFLEKLDVNQKHIKQNGIVWIRDADLANYYRRRHPYIQNVRYSGQQRNQAHASGKEAGKRIVLNKPINHGTVSRGNLLS